MRKSCIGGLIILCIVMATVPAIGAYTIIASIQPVDGSVETEIVLLVRADPKHRNPMYLYVLYDDIYIVLRKAPFELTSTIHSWDVTFTAPKAAPYSNLGKHLIRIKIDNNGVMTTKIVNYFRITKYIPPVIEVIEGPEGPPGERGPPGEAIIGPEGPPGESITGPPGESIQGETGPQGVQGEPGMAGEGIDGSDGKDAPVQMVYLSLILSAIAVVSSLVMTEQLKKVRKQ